jgi:hypothetical protein
MGDKAGSNNFISKFYSILKVKKYKYRTKNIPLLLNMTNLQPKLKSSKRNDLLMKSYLISFGKQALQALCVK